MAAGDALRIPPEASRQIATGDAESRFVLAGAPEGDSRPWFRQSRRDGDAPRWWLSVDGVFIRTGAL